jgi:hypothetical protein
LVSRHKERTPIASFFVQGAEKLWNQEGENNEGWRKLHNEKLHNMYRSPVFVRVIK